MVRALLLAAALVAVPAVAAAQSVRTDCYSHKNRVHCSSTYVPSIAEIIASRPYTGGDPKITAEGNRILAEQAARRRDPRFQDADFQRFRVAQFIGSGDCPGARRYALETTNPATLARVVEFCGKEPSQ